MWSLQMSCGSLSDYVSCDCWDTHTHIGIHTYVYIYIYVYMYIQQYKYEWTGSINKSIEGNCVYDCDEHIPILSYH